MAVTTARIREVMQEKHCDYSTACSWLSKQSVKVRVAKKRAKQRKAQLERQADEQEKRFQQMKAARPDLY